MEGSAHGPFENDMVEKRIRDPSVESIIVLEEVKGSADMPNNIVELFFGGSLDEGFEDNIFKKRKIRW